MGPRRAFLQELKRRRVLHAAAVYGGVAFVIAQIADIAFPALLLPDWSLTLVIVLLVLGFPVALVLAWAFDLTPAGLQRTTSRAAAGEASAAKPAAPAARPTTRPAGWWLIGGGAAVLASAGVGYLVMSDGHGGAGPAAPPERSIAVLPFVNLSDESGNDFFVSGVHEEILTQLSRIADLKVISRSSVMHYAAGPRDLRQISDRLGVGTVLEGSVQRHGTRVRITAQLIDTRTDRHLWAERYDRDLADIFAIQSDVAVRIAAALQANLSTAERGRIDRRPTANVAAYDLYLRARELSGQSREEHEVAIELLRQAIRLDPQFAAAHAALATAYVNRVNTFGYPRLWLDSAEAAARRAIDLQPDLPAAHSALASTLRLPGRLQEALASRLRAIELDPNYAAALSNSAAEFRFVGRLDESLRAAERASELDPAAAYAPMEAAVTAWFLGSDAEAQRWLDEAFARDPQDPWSHMMVAYVQLTRGDRHSATAALHRFADMDPTRGFIGAQAGGDVALYYGDYDDAVAHYERLVRMVPDARHQAAAISFRAMLAAALHRTGQPSRALQLAEQAWRDARRELESGNEHHGLRFELAMLSALRGDREAAYHWLEQAADAGWREHRLMVRLPGVADLSGEVRFQRLLARIEADVAAQRARLQRDHGR